MYYGCTKAKDKNCKCGYINEISLIKQLQKPIDKIDIKKMPIENKIKSEIKRFKKFQSMVTGKNDNININDIDIKNYAKFLLREGGIQEKREIMACFKSSIIINNKIASLD